MAESLFGFAIDVLRLSADLAGLSMALALALLVRTRGQAVLVVANLWLFMEIVATLAEPGYRFGELLWPRLVASAAQVALAYRLVLWWRRWREAHASVAAH